MSLALKLVLSPLLVTQAVLTRRRLPRLPEADGPRSGATGGGDADADADGDAVPADAAATRGGKLPPLRLLIAGDSSAAGVGVATQRDALAGRLAQYLAEASGSAVHWSLHARSGLTTAQTLALLQQQHVLAGADVAVVVTGVNDVIDQVPARRAVAAREALANWLRNSQGVEHVVFAPLPPVHDFPGLPQPLRWVAGSDARRHNAALREWARTRADVSSVAIDLPLNRGVMAADGFHPGAPVYRYCANAIAQHIATTVWPQLNRGERS